MRSFFCLALLLLSAPLYADSTPLILNSGEKKVSLIELFASEGCSSCPPADRFLASLGEQEEAFTTFIPLAFHVDYWDYIGWADPYASPDYSNRQRRYAQLHESGRVYTPGFFINGKEWRGFFQRNRHWQRALSHEEVGNLSIRYANHTLHATFNGTLPDNANLNVAWIGSGLQSSIRRGENRGKTLKHDFVVLHWSHQPMPTASLTLPLPAPPDKGQKQTGLVAWIRQLTDPHPVQAVGGFLSQKNNSTSFPESP